MNELLRYIAITEEIRRLEAEREAIRARAIQHVKNAGGLVDDGEVRVTYIAKPVYRFTGAVDNMREQMARRQRREIERGIAVRSHEVELLQIQQP
jgi:hypothetical protein